MSVESPRARLHDSLRAFVNPLALAVHDAEMERASGATTRFYYDTDILLRMIMGVALELTGWDRAAYPKHVLLRALLSQGFLGTLHVLRPHVIELHGAIRRRREADARQDRNSYRRQIEDYIARTGLRDEIDHLVGAVGEGAGDLDDASRRSAFSEFLRNCGLTTFAYLEQIHGTWTQRLRRYVDSGRLRFDALGAEVEQLLRDESTRKLAVHVNEILDSTRPGYSRSNFIDALSVASLGSMVSDASEGGKPVTIRFYTGSPRLQHVLRDPDIRRHLTLGIASREHSDVLRSTDYLLLRASFSPLRPNPEGELSALQTYRDLLKELSQMADLSETQLRRALSETKLGSTPLLDIVNGFQDLSLTASVWFDATMPEDFFQHTRDWTVLAEYARSTEVRETIFAEVHDIERSLQKEIKRCKPLLEDFARIKVAADEKRDRLGRRDIDPMRDLGLVRWGYSLETAQSHWISEMLRMLCGDNSETERDLACLEVAEHIARAQEDAGECLTSCAILWGLGQYDRIVRLVDAHTRRVGTQMPSLTLIRAAAFVRREGHPRPRLVAMAAELSGVVDSMKEPDRFNYLLGIGFFSYHAWRLESHHGASISDTQLQDWANQSFECGAIAFARLPVISVLARAYAANHCVYVSLQTGVGSDRIDECLKFLQNLVDHRDLWNHRFADTLGVYYLQRAQRLLGDEKGRKPGDSAVIGELLSEAKEYFENAAALNIGDIDLVAHKTQLAKSMADFAEVARRDEA